MDYLTKIINEESKTIAIDFDGVIHSHEYGYHDGTIYGTPIQGSLESIRNLSKKYNLVIYTAKAKKDRPLINGKNGIELIWDWLKKYNIHDCITEITAEKPRCICYIDDKCIRFVDWEQTMGDLKNNHNIT